MAVHPEVIRELDDSPGQEGYLYFYGAGVLGVNFIVADYLLFFFLFQHLFTLTGELQRG